MNSRSSIDVNWELNDSFLRGKFWLFWVCFNLSLGAWCWHGGNERECKDRVEKIVRGEYKET